MTTLKGQRGEGQTHGFEVTYSTWCHHSILFYPEATGPADVVTTSKWGEQPVPGRVGVLMKAGESHRDRRNEWGGRTLQSQARDAA